MPSTVSRELLQQASTNYTEMLHVAKRCFSQAASVTSVEETEPGGYSEEWLLHYMLGKIAEKLQCPPSEYLDHYQKVSNIRILYFVCLYVVLIARKRLRQSSPDVQNISSAPQGWL